MKSLQKLLAAAVLTSGLGLSAFAGQTDTPPCPPPEPGVISTPPCGDGQAPSSGDMDTPTASSTAAGQMNTPSAADSYFTIAASVFESALLLF